MLALRAIRDGVVSTGVHLRAVGILYLANLLCALLLILPLALLLDASIGHSRVAENLAARFDLIFLVDFLNSNAAALRGWSVTAGYGALAYLLL
ncbi:MAG TPA: hypothetical protein VKL61_09980, partial [Candidatus Polarisedimenticolia bacterium]|nr:hypothetical protein [Candidatus Polarisedimenticolia bacterium]